MKEILFYYNQMLYNLPGFYLDNVLFIIYTCI